MSDIPQPKGLHYTSDESPGYTRVRKGRGFSYLDAAGRAVRANVRRRLEGLAVPPAYRNVWYCVDPNGHLQATGIDARGRKQYRYHPEWSAARDQEKFERMAEFGIALPGIRDRLDQDLRQPGFSRERVLAIVVALLEKTLIRIGNEQYLRDNKSYGLTTMRRRQSEVSGSEIRFKFRGKSGIQHEVSLRDRRLSRIIRQLQELPGQELFTYVATDGEVHRISSNDVNQYLRDISGMDFTAKDFRTWAGTLMAFSEFVKCSPCETAAERKRAIAGVIRRVSGRLGNTPAVCRKSYIHARLLEEASNVLPVKCEAGEDVEASLIRFLAGKF